MTKLRVTVSRKISPNPSLKKEGGKVLKSMTLKEKRRLIPKSVMVVDECS